MLCVLEEEQYLNIKTTWYVSVVCIINCIANNQNIDALARPALAYGNKTQIVRKAHTSGLSTECIS
jgi:hypothetical protein